jgi:hypothetical protein
MSLLVRSSPLSRPNYNGSSFDMLQSKASMICRKSAHWIWATWPRRSIFLVCTMCICMLLIAAYPVWKGGDPPIHPGFYKATMDVLDIFEDIQKREPGVILYPTEGILIGGLRFGSIHGSLGHGQVNVVDDDIDFMVGVESEEQWERVATEVEHRLVHERDWYDCWPRKRTAEDFDPDTYDKLRCNFIAPKLRTLWRHRLHLDAHRFIIDKEKKLLYSHRVFDSNGKPMYGGYPYEWWDGILPWDVLFPLSKCEIFGRAMACPNKPIELLRYSHNGEYAKSCLAFPPTQNIDQADVATLYKYAEHLEANGYKSMRSMLDDKELCSIHDHHADSTNQ